jgi:APA family basic amino acid/polyamine antiporter
VYVLANVTYFYVLSLAGVAQSEHVASDVVEQFAGPSAARWITTAMILSALGTLNSSILSGARIPYAMARDGLFFRSAAQIHPTFRTPGRALLFQACLGSLFALTGTFEELFSLVIFAAWIFYGLTVAALFRLRQREPDLERPYRAWGYPWAPALFLIGAFALTMNLWIERPVRSSIGLLLILSGLVFYRHWAKQRG